MGHHPVVGPAGCGMQSRPFVSPGADHMGSSFLTWTHAAGVRAHGERQPLGARAPKAGGDHSREVGSGVWPQARACVHRCVCVCGVSCSASPAF